MRKNWDRHKTKPCFMENLESRLLMSVDSIGDTIASARKLDLTASGQATYVSAIDASADKDVFALTPATSGTLTLTLNSATGSALDSMLTVYSSNGTSIGQNNNADNTTKNARITINVLGGQQYFVQASSSANTTGAYNLLVSGQLDSVGNTITAAKTLNLTASGNATFASAIETSTDKDVFALTPATSGTLTLTLNSATGSTLDSMLTVYSSNGTSIGQNNNADSTTKNARITINVLGGQKYFVQAFSSAQSTGAYNLGVLGNLDSVGNTQATASALPFTHSLMSITNALEYSADKDYFSFVAPANMDAVAVELKSVALDLKLTIFNAAGIQISSRDTYSGTHSCELRISLTPGTIYYIQVSASGVSNSCGAYSLKLTPISIDMPM